jgi:hypothetical protein
VGFSAGRSMRGAEAASRAALGSQAGPAAGLAYAHEGYPMEPSAVAALVPCAAQRVGPRPRRRGGTRSRRGAATWGDATKG